MIVTVVIVTEPLANSGPVMLLAPANSDNTVPAEVQRDVGADQMLLVGGHMLGQKVSSRSPMER
jgi:hypothetical protein